MFNNKELIEKFKEKIIGEDFEFIEAIQGVCWLKEVNNSSLKITIGYKGYPGGYYLQSPFISITFHWIEQKIIESSKKLNLQYNEDDYTIKSKAIENSEFNYNIFENRIESEEKFDELFEAEFEIIKMGGIPFFKKYSDLSNVAELLSNLSPQEVVPYIQGAKLFVKTILILREAKHPKFEQKKQEFYEVLKKQALKKDIYRNQLSLFEELFNK